jgi:hypothetical protein
MKVGSIYWKNTFYIEKTFPQVVKDFFHKITVTHYKDSFNKSRFIIHNFGGEQRDVFFYRIGDVVEVAFIHKKL